MKQQHERPPRQRFAPQQRLVEGRIGKLSQLGQPKDVEGVRRAGEVEQQDGHEHQHAADQRKEEELDGGVFPSWPTPNADEKIHRQQHHFPEHVEQEEVEGQKHAQHARFQQQKQDAVRPDVLDDGPACPHRQHAQKRSQQHERQVDAVDAEEIIDVEGGNPGVADRVLDARRAEHEAAHRRRPAAGGNGQPNGQHEHGQRHEQRKPSNGFVRSARDDAQQQRPRGRQENDQAQQPGQQNVRVGKVEDRHGGSRLGVRGQGTGVRGQGSAVRAQGHGLARAADLCGLRNFGLLTFSISDTFDPPHLPAIA